MPSPRLNGIGLMVSLAALGAGLFLRVPPERQAATTPPVTERGQRPASRSADAPAPRPGGAESTKTGWSPPVAAGPGGARGWQDPSVDPAALARAFRAPPPPDFLPPEARPRPPEIHPPARAWRELEREERAVAY